MGAYVRGPAVIVELLAMLAVAVLLVMLGTVIFGHGADRIVMTWSGLSLVGRRERHRPGHGPEPTEFDDQVRK